MKAAIEGQPRLDLKQALVERLLIEDGKVVGVEDHTGFGYRGRGGYSGDRNFLSGLVHIGFRSIQAGRAGEFAAYGLAQELRKHGFELGRLKTGTPPRLKKSSIDFSRFTRQDPAGTPTPFSLFTAELTMPQLPSYIGRTNKRTHAIARNNLKHSALYGGQISGISARYCPSFEDKIVKFPQKESHQIILEPEGLDTEEIYASGLGNSLPMEAQIELVRSVEGLEAAEIMRPAYAIEYDYLNPLNLKPTLESRTVQGLFLAGQINGTSGYEEAAAQGLWAGINAACRIQNRPAFILDRSQAYMGVMIDDLVTRGTKEPYRMFTSRAEYRLMLREDNADLRLMEIGHALGLIDHGAVQDMRLRKDQIQTEIKRIRRVVIKPQDEVNDYLSERGSAPIASGVHLDQLLKRTELDYATVDSLAPSAHPVNDAVARQATIEIKYEGYIQKQLKEVKRFRNLEKARIPAEFQLLGGTRLVQ